ncbi:MAG: hypothetical protein ACI4E1_12785 [Lachnospira sp.]
MRRKEFIDIILNSISDTFDIYHNYWFKGRKFVIYAYSYNKKNKFNTADDAKLWDSKTYEHLFFINSDNLDVEQFNELYHFAIDEIEPHFVRADGKYPCKNHMYSYISFIIITRNKPDDEVENMIKSSNWSKNYMLGARGFSNIRVACVTPSKYSVVANKNGKAIADFLTEIMLHIDHYED